MSPDTLLSTSIPQRQDAIIRFQDAARPRDDQLAP
jgi:hypothetical protein